MVFFVSEGLKQGTRAYLSIHPFPLSLSIPPRISLLAFYCSFSLFVLSEDPGRDPGSYEGATLPVGGCNTTDRSRLCREKEGAWATAGARGPVALVNLILPDGAEYLNTNLWRRTTCCCTNGRNTPTTKPLELACVHPVAPHQNPTCRLWCLPKGAAFNTDLTT